jgi:ribosome-associated protein
MSSEEQKETSRSEAILEVVGEALLEKKATHIVALDVRGLTSITDFFVVCHANSDTQVKALAENVEDKMREEAGEKPWKREGMENKRWVVLDYVDVVVNIFIEEAREYYGLERIWNDAQKQVITD